jgi:hypothetical protein
VSISELGKRLLTPFVLAYWKRREPPEPRTHGFSMNPSDNVQVAMNLIMPLKDTSAVGRAYMAQAMASVRDEVIAGLNNTGIVHFARFTIVDGNLCMFSMYDGDFSNYIRDFIYNMGSAFDALLVFIKDPPILPVEQHPEEFIDWIAHHNSLQLPDDPTVLTDEITRLSRRLAILLDANTNTQLFAYRAYPGFSVAQIRNELEIGW